MISAKIVADSINESGNRITTMEVVFPRFILAELNTHRAFSRNSASSRAIPFEKMVKSVQENPFIPIAWQKDHKGMQGTEYFAHPQEVQKCIDRWLYHRDSAVQSAKELSQLGITKQLCNRLLEPFMYHKVLITATEFNNFFNLRCPKYSLFSENIPMEFKSKKELIEFVEKIEAPEFKDSYKDLTDLDWLKCNTGQAEIHMMTLAEAMYDAINESTPKKLKAGEWHIPYGDDIDVFKLNSELNHEPLSIPYTEDQKLWLNEQRIKIATARCARVSYTVVGEEGKKPNYENDIKLYDRLLESGHYSPFEHVALCKHDSKNYANFKGFKQIRTILEENV